jgi:hypothetical protein
MRKGVGYMGFWDRMEELVNQGLESSRDILGRAKDKARDLGEKGLLKYEILQLERQAQGKLTQLGVQVYEKLALRGQTTVSRDAVHVLLTEIQDLKEQVEAKERALKEVGNK